MDFESETFVTHFLRADGFDASEDGTGRGTPLVPVELAQTITADMYRSGGAVSGNNDQGVRSCFVVPILEAGARTGTSTTDPRAGIGIGESGDPMFTLQSGKQHAVAFDTTQITSATNGSNPQPGDSCHPLAATAHVPAIALMDTQMAVRRLTPVECERLMGFPDNFTMIPYRKVRIEKLEADYVKYLLRGGLKPKDECFQLAADGPRYKALGNSMAVPCIAWIFERMEAVEKVIAGQQEKEIEVEQVEEIS